MSSTSRMRRSSTPPTVLFQNLRVGHANLNGERFFHELQVAPAVVRGCRILGAREPGSQGARVPLCLAACFKISPRPWPMPSLASLVAQQTGPDILDSPPCAPFSVSPSQCISTHRAGVFASGFTVCGGQRQHGFSGSSSTSLRLAEFSRSEGSAQRGRGMNKNPSVPY